MVAIKIRYGGVWVDTDTVILRDLRPVVEFFGEFGGRFSMNQKFNSKLQSALLSS